MIEDFIYTKQELQRIKDNIDLLDIKDEFIVKLDGIYNMRERRVFKPKYEDKFPEYFLDRFNYKVQ